MRFAKFTRLRIGGKKESSSAFERTSFFAACVLFLLGFAVSFYLVFPDNILKERIIHELEARLPVQVELSKTSLSPLLEVSGDKLVSRLTDQPATVFEIDVFQVNPAWLNFFSGDPGVDGSFFVGEGEAFFHVTSGGAVYLEAAQLPLEIPLATSGVRLTAKLSAGALSTVLPLQKDTQSSVDVVFEDFAMSGGESLGLGETKVSLGRVTVRLSGQGSAFTLEQLDSSGGDLFVAGQGTFMVVPENLQHTRLDCTLFLRADKDANPTLATLLDLIGEGHSDGSRRVRLKGTLVNPIIM